MVKKRVWIPALAVAVLAITYFTGPVPVDPIYGFDLRDLPENLARLEEQIKQHESSLALRQDNEARIVWNDSTPQKTEIAFIYLHGFAGSYRDGYPLNVNLAKAAGANIYLSRWAGHGMKPEKALFDFTPEAAWQSAKEALSIGERIGEKVILVSTSTGGTLAFFLAASFPEKVAGLINIGPNVEDDQPGAFLLNSPWGHELAHLVSLGQHKKIKHESDIAYQYWDSIYPAEALINLQVLVESTMVDSTFEAIRCPVLTMYYRKNPLQEDEHVEVDRYDEVHGLLSTPDSLVFLRPLEKPETHFIGSDIKSKDYKTAQRIALEFAHRIDGTAIP